MDKELETGLGKLNANTHAWAESLERDCSADLRKAVERRQMLVLQGLRRTGKTTLAKKIAFEHLKRNGAGYFSWDAVNPPYTLQRLDELLEMMQEKLVVIDEVQYVPNWQVVLKRHYDRDDGRRFILTGSASLELDKRSHETLAGRIQTFTLKTLSLSEYSKFKGTPAENALEEYLQKGGFPELVNETDPAFIRLYLQDTVLRQFASRDLPAVFPDKNPEFALRVLKLLSATVGSTFQISSLTNTLNSNRITLGSYYHALERGLIIRTAFNFTPSLAKQERTAKKIYFEDNGILTTLNPEASIGALAENALARHLNSLWFYRNSFEVDFIDPEKKIAMELKYQNAVNEEDSATLNKFTSKHPEYAALLVTKNKPGKNGIQKTRLSELLARRLE